jgi:predicted acylesterase/phospholipase RssA
MNSILNIYQEKGLMDVKVFEDFFSPLFRAKDIPIDVTMKQFYEITGIELHLFTSELNNFEFVDITYNVFPDWKVVDAVYCSCCLPIAFKPYLKDNKCYADGGIILNYPLANCLENVEDEDEIFGIKRIGPSENEKKFIQADDSIYDYILFIITAILEKTDIAKKMLSVKNQLNIYCPLANLPDILKTSSEIEERIRLIDYGEKCFLESELFQKIS